MELKTSQNRPAFSMLELVFVIVILGIVSSIGAEVIAKVYKSYIIQRAVHRSSIKTELAATQLANRLAYSIPGTVIGRIDQGNFNAIGNMPADNNHNILEWVGYDADSFGATPPTWSGYCDVSASSLNRLSTPGSSLNNLDAIIRNLSGPGIPSNIQDAAVFFPDTYHARNIGYSIVGIPDRGGVHGINGVFDNNTLILTGRPGGVPRTMKEHYKLSWTAYAVEPAQLNVAELTERGFEADAQLWDLRLYYNYQPWRGEFYDNHDNSILLRNVSVFNFTGTGDTIRFKICQRESIGGEFSINTCKEKAVTR